MMVTKYIIGCDYKIITLNFRRNIQTTQVVMFRSSDNKLRRVATRSQSPFLRRRLIKDSEFTDLNDENYAEGVTKNANFFKEVYDNEMRELKDESKKINKIIMKKSFAKRPKDPNMLTSSERQHMKFLHESDPVEWSVEHLSESFPALPWVVRKILKNKWIPESEEKIKIMDQAVLENWEKFKKNELKASNELLEHLKKFTDRRENLEIQLKNPNFFYLPEMKKKLNWKSGHLNSFLLKYEKEVEKLREDADNVKMLPSNIEMNNENGIYSVKNVEKQIVPINKDGCEKSEGSLVTEEVTNVDLKFRKKEKPVTLQQLKENIFEKSEKENYLISPTEEIIIQNTLAKGDRSKFEISKSNSSRGRILRGENESAPPKTAQTLKSIRAADKIFEKDYSTVNMESVAMRKREKKFLTEKENFDDESNEYEVYPNTFGITQLGSRLFGVKDEKEAEAATCNEEEKTNINLPHVKETDKKTVKSANYFNTEKDKEIFENYEKLLSGSVFWNSQKRNRSLDAGFASASTVPSPHIASHIQTYFTYDYPLKIKIPVDKREKGKLYRVKDCYYDDTGNFLYRVPGMTE